MNYKKFLYFIIFFIITNCTPDTLVKENNNLSFQNIYINNGFALIYDDLLYKNDIVSKKINPRSLIIFQKNLKADTSVKITNILNQRSLIAKVGKKSIYPSFNNSVVSERIAKELDLDRNQPYIKIVSIPKNSMFVAKKAKTFDEEKQVADKAPVDTISINNLKKKKKISNKAIKNNFSYNLKIADFYFKKTALIMIDRIKDETNIKNPKIRKMSVNKYRVYLGPFDNINSLQNSFNDIRILNFENIEYIKND